MLEGSTVVAAAAAGGRPPDNIHTKTKQNTYARTHRTAGSTSSPGNSGRGRGKEGMPRPCPRRGGRGSSCTSRSGRRPTPTGPLVSQTVRVAVCFLHAHVGHDRPTSSPSIPTPPRLTYTNTQGRPPRRQPRGRVHRRRRDPCRLRACPLPPPPPSPILSQVIITHTEYHTTMSACVFCHFNTLSSI